MKTTEKQWQWPLKNYFAGYELRQLKVGDAVLLVEKGYEPRNVIIIQVEDKGIFVGENDYCAYSTYGIAWKAAHPSAGALDYPTKEAAFAEAIWRMDNELHLEADDIPDLTLKVFEDLYESDFFIDAEVCAQITKEAAKDFLMRCGHELSPEIKEKLMKGLNGDC